MTSFFSLFFTRRFLPLFVTQFLGAFNDNLFRNAVILLLTYQTSKFSGLNLEILVSLASGLFILPFFLFSAFAGQISDKFERSRLIFFVKLWELLLMIIAIFGFIYHSIGLLLFVLFMLGTQATFFGPLKYAILPDHLREHELVSGNGLIEAGTFLAILLGTILAGVTALTYYGIILTSIFLVILAIFGVLSAIAIPKALPPVPQLKINFNVIAESWELIQTAFKQWDIGVTILGISWFWLIGGIYVAELPLYTKLNLHANGHVVTFLFTVFSLGISLGAVACQKLLKGRIEATYVPLSAIAITIFSIDLIVTSGKLTTIVSGNVISLKYFLLHLQYWRIAIDLFFLAFAGGVYSVPLYAILQSRSHASERARIISANNIVNALFMVGSTIISSLMLALGFKVTSIFLLFAIVNAVVAVYICKLLPDALVKSFVKWGLQTFYRVNIKGLEHYHYAGSKLVIIANHTSFLDAALISAFLPDKLTFAVNTYTAKKWWLRLIMHFIKSFPLDPSHPLAMKSLIEYVEKGQPCVVFPEGRITVTGALMKIYEGPGLIADKAQANILPIRIEGAQYSLFSRLKGKVRTRWFPRITLTIFPALRFNIPEHYKGRKRRQYIGQELYKTMIEMIFSSSHYQRSLVDALFDASYIQGRFHKVIEDIERKPLNYFQIIMRSFILGCYIAKQTHPEEKVGILLPNANAFVICFFALHFYQRVPTILNFSSGLKNITLACQTAQIKHIYTSKRFVETAKLDDIISKLEKNNIIITYLETLKNKIHLGHKLIGFVQACFPRIVYFRKLATIKKQLPNNLSKTTNDFITSVHSSLEENQISASDKETLDNKNSIFGIEQNSVTSILAIDSDSSEKNNPAVILFTSGSEGIPKGVVLSHQNILANCYQMSACIDFTAKDIAFNALPIFHSFGLTAGLILPLLNGIKVFLYPSPLHYRIVPELVYDVGATIFYSTDTFLNGYAKYAHHYDFYSIRYIFAGAEKLKDETRKLWGEKFGVNLFEGYGATEASPVISMNTPMRNKVGSVGQLLPGISYRIEPVEGISSIIKHSNNSDEKNSFSIQKDENIKDVRNEFDSLSCGNAENSKNQSISVGELWVYGPNIMLGYMKYEKPGVLQRIIDNWYDTGDIVSIDSQGFITIVGRKKRFAKIAGEMVSLYAVEAFMEQAFPDSLHAVINIPDEKKGEQLVLFTTDLQLSKETLIEAAKKWQLAEIAIPKQLRFVNEIPLLGSGKVDYLSLKDKV